MEFKALKFQVDKEEKVVLTHDQPRSQYSEKYGKTSYWYGIKELINGENGFNATQKLHETIQGLGLKANDFATIKKVNNGQITFFTVNEGQVVSGNDNQTNSSSGQDIVLKNITPEVPVQARLNTLESEMKEVKQWMQDLVTNKPIKEGDDKIPF